MTPRERLKRFLDAWDADPTKGDAIYGMWINREDAPRELLASDIRALIAAVPE